MDEILIVKNDGNAFYKQGLKSGDKNCFMQACQKYGKSIEQLLHSEMNLRTRSENIPDLELLKPTLFLNLGMANFQLEEFWNCIVCCNTAIVLCNDSTLTLDNIGVNESVQEMTTVSKPVVRDVCACSITYGRVNVVLLCLYRLQSFEA